MASRRAKIGAVGQGQSTPCCARLLSIEEEGTTEHPPPQLHSCQREAQCVVVSCIGSLFVCVAKIACRSLPSRSTRRQCPKQVPCRRPFGRDAANWRRRRRRVICLDAPRTRSAVLLPRPMGGPSRRFLLESRAACRGPWPGQREASGDDEIPTLQRSRRPRHGRSLWTKRDRSGRADAGE